MLLSVALAPLMMNRIVLPWMRAQDGGAIINIASDAAKVPTPGETVLGAGMAAITLFSRTLAIEAKRYGVRVNTLTPSLVVGTPTGDLAQTAPFSARLFATVTTMAGLGLTVPDDLAELIVFLASPQAARITGQVISVNGGISAG
jgi:NAD(P)-dependent dehydrogenase (short-subunit alcohol dehydrogenase family)